MDWTFTTDLLIVVLPLGAYFGFLGLVNIRRHPTVIGGRLDFLLLVAALLPLLYRPLQMVLFLGGVAWKVSVLAGIGLLLLVLLPREFTCWVIYNVSEREVTRALQRILWRMHIPYTRRGNRFLFPPPHGALVISNMSLFRNVTIYLESARERNFFAELGPRLQRELAATESERSLSGHCFLAASILILAAPLAWLVLRQTDIYAMLMRWLWAG